MEKLFAAVQDWPVLLQGVMGSAIFSLILFFGRRVMDFVSKFVRNYSKDFQTYYLHNELLRHKAMNAENTIEGATYYATILWYRASRTVITGLIWLTLGLLFDSLIGVFGSVGFIGCICYLFAALNVVRPIVYEGDIDKKIEELELKLENLAIRH